MATLEEHYRDLCDIEFTIERGKLWMLQTRVGKRTAAAAFVIADQLVDEGVIDLDEALQPGHRRPAGPADVPDASTWPADPKPLATRRRRLAGRGGRQGRLRLRSARSSWPTEGEQVILVRRETNPDDLPGMIAAQGILTSRGGKTWHAAVVARGMGKTCVCGADDARGRRPRRDSSPSDGHVRQRGRRHLHRRHHRPGLPRRGAGAAVAGRAVLRGRRSTARGRPAASRPCTGC